MGANKTVLTKEDARYLSTFGVGASLARHFDLLSRPRVGHDLVRLVISETGALIDGLWVDNIRLLTSVAAEAEVWPWKRDGTIFMCPAGPSPDKPQHGDSRLTRYFRSYDAGNTFELSGLLRLRNLGHIKRFRLLPHGLQVCDDVVNLGPNRRRLSVGEHFYLPLPEVNGLNGVRWIEPNGPDQMLAGRNDETGEHITGPFSAFAPALLRGETIAIENFAGSAILEIPGIGRVLLSATAVKNGKVRPVSLWIWHRPDTNTICFEPVAGTGVDSKGRQRYDLLGLEPGESLQLTCSIVLLH